MSDYKVISQFKNGLITGAAYTDAVDAILRCSFEIREGADEVLLMYPDYSVRPVTKVDAYAMVTQYDDDSYFIDWYSDKDCSLDELIKLAKSVSSRQVFDITVNRWKDTKILKRTVIDLLETTIALEI